MEGYSQKDKGGTEEAEKIPGRSAAYSGKSGKDISVELLGSIRHFVTD